MKVINLYGAPGSGKSTTMLGLTYQMKMMKYNVENTPEFFKEMIYEESKVEKFGGQLLVLAEQNKRLARLIGKAEYAVSDCPLPLIAYYTPDDYVKGFKEVVKNLHESYENYNIFIERNHHFEVEKRIHDENQSLEIQSKLPSFLKDMGVDCHFMKSSDNLVEEILTHLIDNKIISNPHDNLIKHIKKGAKIVA